MKYTRPYKHRHYLFMKYLIGVFDGGRNIFQQEFAKKKPRAILYSKAQDLYIYDKPDTYKED